MSREYMHYYSGGLFVKSVEPNQLIVSITPKIRHTYRTILPSFPTRNAPAYKIDALIWLSESRVSPSPISLLDQRILLAPCHVEFSRPEPKWLFFAQTYWYRIIDTLPTRDGFPELRRVAWGESSIASKEPSARSESPYC